MSAECECDQACCQWCPVHGPTGYVPDQPWDGEFKVEISVGAIPGNEQRHMIARLLRKVANSLEDYPMSEAGQHRKQRFEDAVACVERRWTA